MAPALKLARGLAARSPGLRLALSLEIERHCGADQILQGRLIDLVAFVKVDEKRLGATKEFQPYGESKNAVAIFSTQPRMLLDAIADYKRFGTLPEAYGWILGAIKDKKVSVKEMAGTFEFKPDDKMVLSVTTVNTPPARPPGTGIGL